MLKNILLVGFGGFAGSVARFLVSRLTTHFEFFSVPLGTLTVNVVGSFLIGLLVGISEKSPILNADLRLLLMVGLCGGFTTFSSFTSENLALIQHGQILQALLYTGFSLLLGFAAVYLGFITSNLL